MIIFFLLFTHARDDQHSSELSKSNPLPTNVERGVDTPQEDVPDDPERHVFGSNNTANTLSLSLSSSIIERILTDGKRLSAKGE